MAMVVAGGLDFMTVTLEAFADTIVPGEKRFPGDAALAGAAAGPGAVAAGALELMSHPATGIADGLGGYADALNGHARDYATAHGLGLPEGLPPFAALDFPARTAVTSSLLEPGHPEKDLWVLLALFANMAFDTAAHMHTTDAIAQGHPGLATIGFAPPGADGLWAFPGYSYKRELARRHPDTTPTGSPA
jgi:enediyne biosynthesis protein E8